MAASEVLVDQLQRRNSAELLHDLESLSRSFDDNKPKKHAASIAISRSPGRLPSYAERSILADPGRRAWSQRISISSFRSRRREKDTTDDRNQPPGANYNSKKGIWSWRPMRALSHITMHRISCLLSAEIFTIHGLPSTMNGLRLSVAIRKKESRDGVVRTMPARVLHGSAEFDETLFVQSNLYCSGGGASGRPIKFEPRPFVVYVVAVDVPELDFGRIDVDLSGMVRESIEKSSDGARVRQWDVVFDLSGKAEGGKLALKLGFQIMEDKGVLIYRSRSSKDYSSSSFARKQSKSSFSIPGSSFRKTAPTLRHDSEKGREDFVFDELAPPPSISPNSDNEPKPEDVDFPEFEVEDKGVEVSASKGDEREEHSARQEDVDSVKKPTMSTECMKKTVLDLKAEEGKKEGSAKVEAEGGKESIVSNDVSAIVAEEDEEDRQSGLQLDELTGVDGASVFSDESAKEVFQDYANLMDHELAKEIEALKLKMLRNVIRSLKTATPEKESCSVHTDEQLGTREFLQMLNCGNEKFKYDRQLFNLLKSGVDQHGTNDHSGKVFVSDLGNNLGCVVQTKDGGYLASLNPLNELLQRKEKSKLTMQVSRPFVLQSQKISSGFEVLQRLAAVGPAELDSELLSLAAMDELEGKTAEQMAYESVALAVLNGRSMEAENSCASKSIAAVKRMATAMSEGRRDRITSGVWNTKEPPVTMEEILAFCLQMIEAMAVDALKIQAGISDEIAPFDISPLADTEDQSSILNSAIPVEESLTSFNTNSTVTLIVVIQLRDPNREYEIVGGPLIAVMQASRVENNEEDSNDKFKVTSLHVGGLKLSSRRNAWDGEKQRLTAMQWLVTHGQWKTGKKTRSVLVKGGHDLLWSLSSKVMADMWLKPVRNPDVKISNR